ncbi:MAG: c-type cytochrome domain-containing protein [Verrucomicrobiota bacterium]
MDESKLPAPAAVTVDFARDIKPILDASCLRCHGPEKPKNRFRLDNRADALKGGDNGVDILPGHSAQSPLIHNVAQLVPDLEMPPPDKGDPLTPAQIGLLRAWIDQGVAWDAGSPADKLTYSISPVIGGTIVSGDAQKFREHYWQTDGVNGGLAQFELTEKTSPDTKLSLSGHALLDDYKLELSLGKNDFGFIHSGWEQYRKYFDGTGGYDPLLSRSAPSLGSDLHLDIGKAWVDFGLTLPNWPQMVLGYEQDYKDGAEATTDWNAFAGGGNRNFAPAGKALHEEVNVIKFDLDHEAGGVAIEERFRGEFYNLNTHYTNLDARDSARENVHEGNSYFQGANTLRLEKKFTDWFFGSAGYLYSKLNSDASFTDASLNNHLALLDAVPQITLEKQSHVFNANGLLGPFDGLTLSTGVESEWTRQHGFGGGGAFLNPIYTNGTALSPASGPLALSTLSSDYDEASVSESAALRYGKIPYTVLFADARFQQQSIGQSDYDLQPVNDFIQNTAFASQMTDFRLGFNTSPWRTVSFSAHYRRYEDNSQYQDPRNAPLPAGYPGFMRQRDLLTDEMETKLVWHPCSWFKTTWSWQYLTTDYSTVTDADPAKGGISPGGDILAGQYVSRIYSINTTLTPCPRLCLSTAFSWQPTTSISAANGVPGVVPYRGDIYSVLANGTYALSAATDLFANYSFSAADYAQNSFAAGLPVGIEYAQHAAAVGLARRFGKNLTAKLQYGYYHYAEPTSGGANNYAANSIFATLTFRGP